MTTCDHCEEPAEFFRRDTACGRDHCPEHLAYCAACQKDMADEWEALA